MTTTITPLGTHRNETPYPFCPGCGHGSVLDTLDRALVRLDLDPAEVVIVSDIGCAGLSDQYFATSAFHGLHGRSITYATGIELARPELTVVVVMGDGGTGIGGAHLINAARRNVSITVIVLNNLNFGMTGGQHSTTSPEGFITSTTPEGNLEHPLDICGTAAVNGAAYVYRGTSFDKDLDQHLADAIRHPGFALLDVWELCTAYAVPNNKLGKKGLDGTIERLGFRRGVLIDREVTGYEVAYRDAAATLGPSRSPSPIPVRHEASLEQPLSIVIAGSAGTKVRSAASLVARGAIRSGLWVTQRGDYPVTVKTGHSVSELVVAAEPLPPVAVTHPDLLVLVSEDGRRKVGGMLVAMGPGQQVVTTPDLADVVTDAELLVVDPKASDRRIAKTQLALSLLAFAVEASGIYSVEALRAAAAGPYEQENLAAIDAGIALAG